jgi:acetyl esterase/lipase
MTFDVIGFGDSDDPYGRGPEGLATAFDRPAQVRAALDWLVARPTVDASDVTLLGHSAGTGPAIVIGTSDPRVDRIATMVSPPPRDERKAADGGAERAAYFAARADDQYRYIYGHDVPGWFRPEMKPDDSTTYHDGALRLEAPGHPPYLLILGERDEPGGHAEELRILGRMTAPADVLPVPRADHYLNSAQSLGLVFFDRDVAEAFGAGMVEWLTATR